MSMDAGHVAPTKYKNMAEFTQDLASKEIKGNPLKKLAAIVFGSGVALKVSGKTYVVDRKHFASSGIKDAKGMREFVVSQVKGFQKAAENLEIRETSKQQYAMELLKNLNELEGESRSITAFFDSLRGTGSLDDDAVDRLKDNAVEVTGKKDVWKLDADTLNEIRTLCGVKVGVPIDDDGFIGGEGPDLSPLSSATTPEGQRFLKNLTQIKTDLGSPTVTPNRDKCVSHLKAVTGKEWDAAKSLPDAKRNEIWNAAIEIRNQLKGEDLKVFDRMVKNADQDLSGFPGTGKKVQ